jgi:hypothetical protein
VLTAQGWGFAVPVLFFLGFAVYAGLQARRALRPPAIPMPLPPAQPARAAPAYDGPVVPLAEQIAALRRIGLPPHPELTEETLLKSFDRDEYEKPPYQTLLFMCCAEMELDPAARPGSEWGWNFDLECVEGETAYAAILQQIERLAGRPGLITDVAEVYNRTTNRVRLSYRLADKPYTLNLRLDNDWADAEGLMPIFRQVETELDDGRSFWMGDNGQSILVLYILPEAAEGLNALSPDLVNRLA